MIILWKPKETDPFFGFALYEAVFAAQDQQGQH